MTISHEWRLWEQNGVSEFDLELNFEQSKLLANPVENASRHHLLCTLDILVAPLLFIYCGGFEKEGMKRLKEHRSVAADTIHEYMCKCWCVYFEILDISKYTVDGRLWPPFMKHLEQAFGAFYAWMSFQKTSFSGDEPRKLSRESQPLPLPSALLSHVVFDENTCLSELDFRWIDSTVHYTLPPTINLLPSCHVCLLSSHSISFLCYCDCDHSCVRLINCE